MSGPEEFAPFADLSEDIGSVMPLVGARFIAGLDEDGKRVTDFEIHHVEGTTVMDVVGLVETSLHEWLFKEFMAMDDDS